MKDDEELLKCALDLLNDKNNNAIFGLVISNNKKYLLDVLFEKGLIKAVKSSNSANNGESIVSFDFTYEGLHYFDE